MLAISASLMSASISASPWIGTLDPQLHQDLVTLVEYRVIDAAVNSYPVPWNGISQQLENVDTAQLAPAAQSALDRLRHYMHQQKKSTTRSFVEVYGATDSHRFSTFDGEQAPSGRISQSTEFTDGQFSAQLTLNYDAGGGTHLDQSYLAYQVGGWNFSFNTMDQWWGPAHSSSLILSTNARPLPSMAVSRASAVASESPWLSWLGPWYFTAQVGQFESDRPVPNARLWRTRFNFTPIRGLEIGASWAAMWGGDGQPGSISDFIDVITFKVECIDDLPSCDPELETTKGNHIAGFDIKYSFLMMGTPVAIYAQRVGEDAVDGYRVTDNANLFGFSTYLFGARVYLESSDTNVSCLGDGSTLTNCYYEHGTYTDGYRHYNRVLGSTFDSDAKQTSLGINYQFNQSNSVALQLSRVELNPDGTRPSPVITTGTQEDLVYLSGFYQTVWRDFQIKVGGTVSQRDFEGLDSETDVTGYVNIRYALFN
jgi:hypothetical protein